MMGGGSSRFEETDWEKADGKLTSSEETIDGKAPTTKYGIYYLTKLSLANQRAYDVTDEEANLLYSTRAVEGTLAWFDVLGHDDNNYLLRVQVDLSRRYWVVYRYGIPSFAGQVFDMDATARLACRSGPHKPLFRRACITVTWHRYHAVVAMYEPAPTEEDDVKEQAAENIVVEEKKSDDDDGNLQAEQTECNGGETTSDGMSSLENDGKIGLNTEAPLIVDDSNKVTEAETSPIDSNGEMTRNAENIKRDPGTCISEPLNTEATTDTRLETSASGAAGVIIRISQMSDTGENVTPPTPVETDWLPNGITATVVDGREAPKAITKSFSLRAIDWVKTKTGAATSLHQEATTGEQNLPQNDGNDANGKAPHPSQNVLESEVEPSQEESERLANDTEADESKRIKPSRSSASLRESIHWVKAKAEEIVTAPYQPRDREEGRITLNNKPVLKVQEINSILGQHQTMLVHEDEAKKLRDEELLLEAKLVEQCQALTSESETRCTVNEALKDALCACASGSLEEPPESPVRTVEDLMPVAHYAADSSGAEQIDAALAPENCEDEISADASSSPMSLVEGNYAVGKGRAEVNENGANNADVPATIDSVDENDELPTAETSNEDTVTNAHDDSDEQPLVGFWSWDNSLRVHKMKMHVGKGGDLALHVVLAVITNQLRYERHAIAVSV